jgi:hypothetical protein
MLMLGLRVSRAQRADFNKTATTVEKERAAAA